MRSTAPRACRSVLLLILLLEACSSSGQGDHGGEGGAAAEDGTSELGARPGPLGAPMEAAEHHWTWIDLPDSRCRDGSTTGLGVSFGRGAGGVVVYLDQGGACFNQLTCSHNPASYGGSAFATDVAAGTFDGGIFARSDDGNPVREWSYVFVPYCTGDVHAGDNPAGQVTGVAGLQRFHGLANLDAALARVVPTFPAAAQVLLAGSSAGGFGVLLAAEHAARWFRPIPVIALSDSGPPLPSSLAEPCLQAQWSKLWGFRPGVLDDCGAACAQPVDYIFSAVKHFTGHGAGYRGGLVSSVHDSVIPLFLAFGRHDCAGGLIAPDEFAQALLATRSTFQQAGTAFATYYIDGSSEHVWLTKDATFGTSVAGVSLKEWLADLLSGTIRQVGP